MKRFLLIGLVLIMALAITSCGTDNANTGDEKAGGNGDAAKTEAVSLDTVEKISAEWLTAGHANVGEPLSYAGVRTTCGVCHSGNAMERYGTDNPYAAKGIESHPDDRNKRIIDTHEAELPSPIGCATCHSGAGADILKSGVIPAELNAFGDTEWNVGNSNALCFTCHNARRDVDHMYKSWTTEGAERENEYPHHGWGALVTGQGGMEYPDVEYAQSEQHLTLGCTGCHMPEKDGYVSHDFKPDLATCKGCHSDATEFSLGGGLEKELTDKLAKLEELVLAKIPGAVEIGASHGTTPAVDADGEAISNADLPVEALVGAYNYAIIKQELEHGGKGIHNPKYAKALLDESIKKLEALK